MCFEPLPQAGDGGGGGFNVVPDLQEIKLFVALKKNFLQFLKIIPQPSGFLTVNYCITIMVLKSLKYSTVLRKYKKNVPSSSFFPRGIAPISSTRAVLK
jgi:hypothetical protein